MTNRNRPTYDCDTAPYWCSDDAYMDSTRTFGRFIEDGAAYEITDRNTPRPWLNYLCNDRFGAVVSNDGLGFTWYKTTLLRITKYEHPIDYLPRDFQDGRLVLIEDIETGETWNAFDDATPLRCTHRPGSTVIEATHRDITVSMTLFVPQDDSAECWMISLANHTTTPKKLRVTTRQVWTFSKFGIHTAEEGIPYLSTPGKELTVQALDKGLFAETRNAELPIPLAGLFWSPQATRVACTDDVVPHRDGRSFRFKQCAITTEINLPSKATAHLDILAAADENAERCRALTSKYTSHDAFASERDQITRFWKDLLNYPSCRIPDPNMQLFLNTWLKNQLFLTFRFVRSGYIGYRDTLQDTWGYLLIEPEKARTQFLRTLAHMQRDGSCPRNYPPVNDQSDLRRFMDSGTWIPMTLLAYIQETGDTAILNETIPYLDGDTPESVEAHVWKALELLFHTRGQFGLCKTGDGDWNDALEGISKSGDAVSAWLTMALFHAQNLMVTLYAHVGQKEKADILRERSILLREALHSHAWDGKWYLYGYTGSGKPIGSHKNTEGIIHLNAQTWAIFTGLATEEQTRHIQASVKKHLDTDLGPALLAPPYVHEASEVGRIAKLEPGTFENGSIYQHAVTFQLFADLASGHYDEAGDTFARLLPTNPANFDARRTSEPYCMGNYYCGPTHQRYGQNFFTWFTGNPAWLLRAGFDEMLGVKAEFDGLRILPKVPTFWKEYEVTRRFRGCVYHLRFQRAEAPEEKRILLDGTEIDSNLIPPCSAPEASIHVFF
ncbi:MAG: hypothetical protein PHP44_10335 [Kiritimatiellae bacterium]|nr:hypothetical protein [Kiritimatiellia bacterium]MDD4736486.1 hypothetical protein [Kiritimatiellia bacterium]